MKKLAVAAALLAAFAVFVGCPQDLTEPPDAGMAELSIVADVSGTNITGLVVEVTGVDIPEPLIFNIPINAAGIAQGMINIPAGSDRRILIRAYDDNSIETHRGDTVVDVVPGQNPPITILLYPLMGDVPILVELGSYRVEVNPTSGELFPGETIQLSATIYDGEGNVVEEEVRWASSMPTVATVDANGLVTGVSEGVAEIVANYGNVRGVSAVQVWFSPSLLKAYVRAFAPILKFDGSAPDPSLEDGGLPMDAQLWFDEMLCGETGGPQPHHDAGGGAAVRAACAQHSIPWGNGNMDPLLAGEVPTYFRARIAPTGQLRIDYWWFYGHQPKCDFASGDHIADWEHVKVVTSTDHKSVVAVVYYQHAGWYTRIVGSGAPNFPYEMDSDPRIGDYARPIAYVGKNSHGAYDYPNDHWGDCRYFEDWRNPSANTVWRTHEGPLYDLDGDEQAWMAFDRLPAANWYWGYTDVGTHPTKVDIDFGMKVCHGYNAFGSDYGCGLAFSYPGKVGLPEVVSDCKATDTDCGIAGCAEEGLLCVLAPWTIYAHDWWLPTVDEPDLIRY